MSERLLALAVELVELGLVITLRKGEHGLVLEFPDGFYKSDGHATARETDLGLYLFARYQEQTEIRCARDVVAVSYNWWQSSKGRFEGWKEPEPKWGLLYQKFELET